MKTEYILLKETKLTNNCPECYNAESLQLSFKQEKKSSKFLTRIKGQIIEHLFCRHCETKIYPGMWTEDIERVYNYHKKTIEPIGPSFKLNMLFFLIIFLILSILAMMTIYFVKPEIFGL